MKTILLILTAFLSFQCTEDEEIIPVEPPPVEETKLSGLYIVDNVQVAHNLTNISFDQTNCMMTYLVLAEPFNAASKELLLQKLNFNIDKVDVESIDILYDCTTAKSVKYDLKFYDKNALSIDGFFYTYTKTDVLKLVKKNNDFTIIYTLHK